MGVTGSVISDAKWLRFEHNYHNGQQGQCGNQEALAHWDMCKGLTHHAAQKKRDGKPISIILLASKYGKANCEEKADIRGEIGK